MTDFCTAFTAHGTPGCTTLPFIVDCLYNCFCLSLSVSHQLHWSSRPPLWERRTSGSFLMGSMLVRRALWWNSKKTKLVCKICQ